MGNVSKVAYSLNNKKIKRTGINVGKFDCDSVALRIERHNVDTRYKTIAIIRSVKHLVL